MKNQSFARRFAFAWMGIVGTVRGEASFRTQLFMALIAALVLCFIKPPLVWLALCIIAAGLVLALELLNTALEHLADRVHPERHEDIRRAKDCAAAAVLLASLTAVVIGALTVGVSVGWLKP